MQNHWEKPARVWLLPIESGGEPRRIEPSLRFHEDTGYEPDLSWLQRTIGCDMVEFRSLRLGHLWLDEEGKLKSAPESRLNPVGTVLHQMEYDPHDFIVGPAVLVVHPSVSEGYDDALIREANRAWDRWRAESAEAQA